MLPTMESEDGTFCAGNVLIAFRWVREGLFRFMFEMHRSSTLLALKSAVTQRIAV